MSTLEEQAGEVGVDLAHAIATKIKQTIDGYPAQATQHIAVARLVVRELGEYADGVERAIDRRAASHE